MEHEAMLPTWIDQEVERVLLTVRCGVSRWYGWNERIESLLRARAYRVLEWRAARGWRIIGPGV